MTSALETPAEGEPAPTPIGSDVLFDFVQRGSLAKLVNALADEELLPPEDAAVLLNTRNEFFKSPLDVAAAMGRQEITKELLLRGADVMEHTKQGYSALHHSAAWGRAEVLKQLYFKGGDIQLRTVFGERPVDLARRYGHDECADFLDWAEVRNNLIETIRVMRETTADPEKVQGRLTKEDKKLSESACADKENWLNTTPDPTIQQILQKNAELDDILSPIWSKLNEPVPEKK